MAKCVLLSQGQTHALRHGDVLLLVAPGFLLSAAQADATTMPPDKAAATVLVAAAQCLQMTADDDDDDSHGVTGGSGSGGATGGGCSFYGYTVIDANHGKQVQLTTSGSTTRAARHQATNQAARRQRKVNRLKFVAAGQV